MLVLQCQQTFSHLKPYGNLAVMSLSNGGLGTGDGTNGVLNDLTACSRSDINKSYHFQLTHISTKKYKMYFNFVVD